MTYMTEPLARPSLPMTPMSSAATVDALWLDMLHRLCARAAHELKGALNGVSVNLEVVRSRAEKPGTAASALAPYASAASGQFDVVMEMSAALLTLAREPRVPVDLGQTVRHVGVLLERAANTDGRRLDVDASVDELGATT